MIDTDGNFRYTDEFTAWNSSVIDSVYWNSDDKQLFVWLNSDIGVGYENVSADVWKALTIENDASATSGSVGSYWNKWIKGHPEIFPGFDTSAIEDVLYVTQVADNSKSEDVTPAPASAVTESDEINVVVFYELDGDGPFEQLLTVENLGQVQDTFDYVMETAGVVGASAQAVLYNL